MPRVPGNGGSRIELVPLAIFRPPSGWPSSSRMKKSSILSRLGASSRSLTYIVWPLIRWPEPGMMLSVVRPPATARLKPGIVHVDRVVECARRAGSVRCRRRRPAAGAADVAVRADQARHDRCLPATSICSAPSGICHGVRRADGDDLALFDRPAFPFSISSPSMGMIFAPTKARGRSSPTAGAGGARVKQEVIAMMASSAVLRIEKFAWRLSRDAEKQGAAGPSIVRPRAGGQLYARRRDFHAASGRSR